MGRDGTQRAGRDEPAAPGRLIDMMPTPQFSDPSRYGASEHPATPDVRPPVPAALLSPLHESDFAYEQHWGLRCRPFDNVPDPRFYVATAQHETARQRLLYGIQARKGAVMLTGDVGCGKTLLSRALVLNLPETRYDVALIANPSFSSKDFLCEVLNQLGIAATGSKVRLLHRLNEHLLANYQKRVDTVIVIDEAQAIESRRLFEELRLLLNFQTNDAFLVTLVLMGQPELRQKVDRIPQFSQRIAVRCHLAPFTLEEARAYVAARLLAAGTDRALFSKEALTTIYEQGHGVCRLINTLCDLCLLLGAMAKMSEIDETTAREAANIR